MPPPGTSSTCPAWRSLSSLSSRPGLAVRVEGFTGLEETIGMARGYALLSGLLALWLALLAGGCVWLGLRLRQADAVVEEPG